MSNQKESYDISKHKDEIITGIIKNLVWVPIAAIIPVVWGLIKTLSKNLLESKYLTFSNILAGIAIVISLACIFILLKIRFFKGKRKPAEDSESTHNDVIPLTDFRINSIVAEMHIKDNNDIISTLDYELTANKDDLQFFQKSVLWTGDKYNGTKLKSSNSTDYTFHDMGGNDGYHIYQVRFNKEVKCLDKIEFTLETSVSDSNHQMQPFYGYCVKHQVDKLTLRVVAPPNMIRNIRQNICWDWERLMNVGEPKTVSKEVIGGNEVYQIEVHNPTLLYKYFLEWEFTT